jgi:hypothetical protein
MPEHRHSYVLRPDKEVKEGLGGEVPFERRERERER